MQVFRIRDTIQLHPSPAEPSSSPFASPSSDNSSDLACSTNFRNGSSSSSSLSSSSWQQSTSMAESNFLLKQWWSRYSIPELLSFHMQKVVTIGHLARFSIENAPFVNRSSTFWREQFVGLTYHSWPKKSTKGWFGDDWLWSFCIFYTAPKTHYAPFLN